MSPQIAELHKLYVDLTGMPVRLDMARENEWYQWIKYGFGVDDLRLMITHLKKQIREGNRNPGALKFRNLIGRPDYFEEDLGEAKAMARIKKHDPEKVSVLSAVGRQIEPPQTSTRTPADIIAGEKAFEDFRRFKQNL